MKDFDPYHKWLGIPPEQQPPNHYRLLGLEQFEADPDTISNAADRQMAHVRSFQTGQNSEVSQRILNEIAAARVCLLDPTKKFAYDVGLKEALRPVVTPVVNQRPVSKMNTQMVLLTLGAVAVCVLVVVLLLSRSKPTMARPPVAEKPAQTREASSAKPSNEDETEPKAEPKQEPQSKPNVKIGDFAGTWAIKYGGGYTRIYAIGSDGSAFFPEEDRQGRLFTKDGKVLLDFSDGKLERLELADSKLRVEHFNPATEYPNGIPLLGVGERQTGESQQVAKRTAPSSKGNSLVKTKVAAKAPEPKPLPQVKNLLEPATTAKLPIPDAPSQDKARSQVKELFDADHTAAKGSSDKLSALASKLLEKVQEATDEASQYVLLDLAKTFSVEAGNAALAMRAIDQIADRFQCDVLALKVESIAACAKLVRTPEQMSALLTTLEPIIQASLAEADFDTAKNLNRGAVELARKIRDSATLKRLVAANREIEDWERQYHRDIEPAREVLKRTPEDPTSNLAVGKYLCLRGNWEKGLPMLALGSDSELKSLATADLKSPESVDGQMQLADEWWDFASKHEEFRARARQRAGVWYQKAVPMLTGLRKEVAARRIAESGGDSHDDGPVVKRIRFSSPESLKAFVPTSIPQISIHNGTVLIGSKSSSLMPLVYNGYFEEITSVRIVGGIVPPEKFNFRLSVGPINVILNWEGGDQNHLRFGGRSVDVSRPRALIPGKFHEIVIKQDGDKAVIMIDGKQHFAWTTKLKGTISIYPYKSVLTVREIVIEGRLDSNKKVTGPSHNNIN